MANILLIDDDTTVNLAMGITLKDAGHQVVSLFDGSQVLRHMLNTDLVITDVIMPTTDGIEVLNTIKQTHPHVPVIVISGGGRMKSDVYLGSAKVIGAKAVLQKPVEPDELINTVNHVLNDAKT